MNWLDYLVAMAQLFLAVIIFGPLTAGLWLWVYEGMLDRETAQRARERRLLKWEETNPQTVWDQAIYEGRRRHADQGTGGTTGA